MALTMSRRGILFGGAAAFAIGGYRVSPSWAAADPFEAAKWSIVLADGERFELGWILREAHPLIAQYMVRADSGSMDFLRSSAVQSYSGTAAMRGCRALLVTSEVGPVDNRYHWPTRVIDVLAHDDPRSIAAREQAYLEAERNAVWRECKVEGSCRWRSLTSVRGRYASFHVNKYDNLEPYRYADNGSRVWVRSGTSWDGQQPFDVSDVRPFGVAPETGPERKSRSEGLRDRRLIRNGRR